MTITAHSRLWFSPDFFAPRPDAFVEHGYLPQPQSRFDSSKDISQTITHPLTRVIIQMVLVVVVFPAFRLGADFLQ
jgi:hypothetical protein